MKKIVFILSIIALLTGLFLIITGRKFFSRDYFSKTGKSWSDTLQREYANTLFSKGLLQEASVAYDDYISKSSLPEKELAAVCYKLGNIYMDLNDYGKALSNFYKVELLDKNPVYKQEMNRKIVEALENLGLKQQANYELEKRTSLGVAEKPEGKVIARIGKRQIGMSEIEQVLTLLPEQLQKTIRDDKSKLGAFIKNYVNTEVLYEQAKKLDLEKTPKFRAALDNFKKEFILQEMIAESVTKKIEVTPQDVELYYKANKDKYATGEKIKVSYLELVSAEQKIDTVNKLKGGLGKKIDDWIERAYPVIPILGGTKENVAELFSLDKNAVSEPIVIKDKSYLFLIEDKELSKQMSFEEVRERAEYEYRLKKEQEAINELLKKALEQQEVEMYFNAKNNEKDEPDKK